MSSRASNPAPDRLQRGTDRSPAEPPAADRAAPVITDAAPSAREELRNPIDLPDRPAPGVPRSSIPDLPPERRISEFQTQMNDLNLAERFIPEARDLTPALIRPHFTAQSLYNQIQAYYEWRFRDISFAADAPLLLAAQIQACSDRVAFVTLNAIVNKLIIAARADNLQHDVLVNPTGPPKGFLFPSLACSIITAVGKTSPLWSGDQFFVPDLNNEIPQLVNSLAANIPNIHQFVGNPAADQVIARFCSIGNIPMRTVDWKIPGGSPHWLLVREDQNGRTMAYLHSDVHPDNFDPPNTVLGIIAASTAFAANNTRYVILKGVATAVIFSLASKAYEV